MSESPFGNITSGETERPDQGLPRLGGFTTTTANAAAAHPNGAGGQDDAMRVLGDVQSGLAGVRSFHEQAVRLGEELNRKRAALAQEYTRLTNLRQECATERAAAQALRAELETTKAELLGRQNQLDKAAAALRTIRAELEAGKAELAAAREAFLHEDRVTAAAAGGDTARQLAELTARLESEAQRHATELAQASAAKTDLEAQVASLQERITTLEADLVKARAGSLESDGESAALRQRLQEVESERARLERQLTTTAGSAADALSWNARRRERLHRYKTLLQAQARKIVAAKEALGRRQAECETLLSQRQKLNAAMDAVRQKEKKLESKQARASAAVALLAVAATLTLISALSWAVVRHIVPATYVARTIIEPDGRGIALGESEIAAWQIYHAELVRDPRMIEEAADRFRKRGIVSLGSPPELAARLNADLYVQRQDDGGLLMELRGQGSEKTARELETLVTAVAAVANAARANRADGAVTTIVEPAAAGAEPVEDHRMNYAVALAGGGTGAAALLGMVLMGRMSRVKRRYEEDVSLERTMEELAWAVPGDAAGKK